MQRSLVVAAVATTIVATLLFVTSSVTAGDTSVAAIPAGVYCGSAPGGTGTGATASIQVAQLFAAIQVHMAGSLCEFQLAFSNHVEKSGTSSSASYTVPWVVHYASCGGSVAAGKAVSIQSATFDPSTDGGSLSFSAFIDDMAFAFTSSKATCAKGGVVAPSWIPVGDYCNNLLSSISLSVGPNSAFEIDAMGCMIKGTYTITMSTGKMAIKITKSCASIDIQSFLGPASYSPSTNTMSINITYEGTGITISGSRLLCNSPPSGSAAAWGPSVVKAGPFCGTSANNKYVALTLTQQGMFTLAVDACTAQGAYLIHNKTAATGNNYTISFLFATYVDCLAAISVSKATVMDPSSLQLQFTPSGSAPAWTAALALPAVGDSSNDAQFCHNVSSSSVQVPKGLYCLPRIADVIPAGFLSLAIFGNNKYQLWAGNCEAHGYFSVAATGVVTLHEKIIASSCPTEVEVTGARWDPLGQKLKVSATYQGFSFDIAASQADCEALTPAGLSVPSGLYCDENKIQASSNNNPAHMRVSVIGSVLDVTIDESCTLHGSYTLHQNSIVGINSTTMTGGDCKDLFLHTVKYLPASLITPSGLRFLGYYNGKAMNFTAYNCSSPYAEKAAQKNQILCFSPNVPNVANGEVVISTTAANFYSGSCVVKGMYNVLLNGSLTYVVTQRTSACGQLTMRLVGWTTQTIGGTTTKRLTIKISDSSTGMSMTIPTSECPTMAPTTTTTVATTTTAAATTTAATTIATTTKPTTTASPPQPQQTTTAAPPVITTSATPTTTTKAATTSATPATTTAAPPVPTTTAGGVAGPTTTSASSSDPFAAGKSWSFTTSNQMAGSLEIKSAGVALLKIGGCTQEGKLVAEAGGTYAFEADASKSSSGCSDTKLSSFTFKKEASADKLDVAGSINGATVSAAATDDSASAPASPASGGAPIGVIVAVVCGVLVLAAIALFVYKKKTSAGDGQSAGGERNVNFRVGEEMLADIAYSAHAGNINDRASIQGDAGSIHTL